MNILIMHTNSRTRDNLDYKVVGVLSNDSAQSCPFYADERVEALENFDDTYTLSVPANRYEATLLRVGAFLLLQDETSKHRLFRIYELEDEAIGDMHFKKVNAENAFINDLNKTAVQRATLKNVNFPEALAHVLSLSGWIIKNAEYLGEIKSLTFDGSTNAQSELQSILSEYQGEIDAYVKVVNGRIVGKYFDLVEERGRSRGRRFEYRRDIVGVKRITTDAELYTAVKARGKDGLTFSTINDGSDTLFDDNANELYNDGREYLVGFFEYDTDNPVALRALAQEWLNKHNYPKYNYEIDTALLDDDVWLGDTIKVVDFEMVPEITVSARVIEKRTSYSEIEKSKVTLGEFIELEDNMPDEVAKLRDQLTNVADGIKPIYKIEIYSTNGIVIKNGIGDTKLTARIYKNSQRTTGKKHQYLWEKIYPDGSHDVEWETANAGVGDTIFCPSIDFVRNISYKCSYLTDEYNYVQTTYFRTEIDRVIGVINSLKKSDSIIIPYITDTHYATDAYEYQQNKQRSLMHMNNVVELTHQMKCDLVVHGGDIVDGKTSNYVNKVNLKAATDVLNDSDCPVLWCKGNHDDNWLGDRHGYGGRMEQITKPKDIGPILKDKYNAKGINHNQNDNAIYGYYDIPGKKIRVITLDSFDLRYDLTNSKKKNKYPSADYGAYQSKQIEWLINALKTCPTDYQVITFHHYAMIGALSSSSWKMINGEIITGILNAWQNGTSYKANGKNSDYPVSVNVSFTGKRKWITAVNGHWHSDKAIRTGLGNTPTIMTTCSLAVKDNDDNPKTLGNAQEDAWDVIMINPSEAKIHFVRYGTLSKDSSGNTREYRTYSY